MPKVSQQYLNEKRNYILDCTKELMKSIPLYNITMRDIIKKVDCSQGLIYRYYANVDEIYVELMNREISDIPIRDRIIAIQQTSSKKNRIRQLITELGSYILEVQGRIGGKFYFELLVSYAFDEHKQTELLPKLIFKQNLMWIQTQIVESIAFLVNQGTYALTLSLSALASYAGAAIDGISNHIALTKSDNKDQLRNEGMEMFEMLGAYVANCLIETEKRE